VEGSTLEPEVLFEAISESGARAVLIGRQAIIALGIPVVTSDYDLWVHIDDIELLNRALAPLGLLPSHSPEESRARGRYVLENGEHVDVLVARFRFTVDGVQVSFDELWARRQTLLVTAQVEINVPALDDLIATKRFAARSKDAEDIRLLEVLRSRMDG
jgi:hypothetical protein